MIKCIDCHKVLTGHGNPKRCPYCAQKEIHKDPTNSSGYKDGRCLKIYHCKDCKKEITYASALYGQGRCRSCARRRRGKKYENITIYNREYSRKWRKNLNNQLLINLRGRIYVALKRGVKSYSTIQLLGCSIERLKIHLEKQFKEGMTWKNYGLKGWVIDHIRPCALFDLTDPIQQFKCFNYTNLQPLWYKENLIKGANYVN
jgi:hypothetical protein